MATEYRLRLLDEDDDRDYPFQEPGLKINDAYAKRFAHNKQREALHRLQELEKRGFVDDDESSDDADEDENGLLPASTDARIFETLTMIKKKDPSIYSQEMKFFDDVQQEEEGFDNEYATDKDAGLRKNPVYLKDALAKQLMEGGPDLVEKTSARKISMTYSKEQQELKNAFLQSVADAESDEEQGEEESGLLKIRKKSKEELGREKRDEEEVAAEAEHMPNDGGIMRRLEDYFGKDDALNENEKFLKDYLLNQRWIDQHHDKIPSYDEIVGNVSEDEEELKRQEKFEAEYNFRFEEGVGSQVLGHSRYVEGSVRKTDEFRKKQREKKKERLSRDAFERREELKRLKNIKKKEILEKLEKIRNVAGAKLDEEDTFAALGEDDLEEDFDPAEYDQKMRGIFGDAYYQAEDVDANFQGDEEEIKKPNFDAEDEALRLPKGWDGSSKLGFAEARQKAKEAQKPDVSAEFDSAEDTDVENSEEIGQVQKKPERKKGKVSLREKLAFDKQLEEYYRLDYEDVIGDLPTRFKYRQVKPNTYGLSALEVLTAGDKELNQYVSLKKMAPYTTEEWVPKKYHRLSQKMRKKMALNSSASISQKVDKTNLSGNDETTKVDSKDEATQQSTGEIKRSTKRRKNRKRAALQLSQSRLIAYGKISLPSKKRRKA